MNYLPLCSSLPLNLPEDVPGRPPDAPWTGPRRRAPGGHTFCILVLAPRFPSPARGVAMHSRPVFVGLLAAALLAAGFGLGVLSGQGTGGKQPPDKKAPPDAV